VTSYIADTLHRYPDWEARLNDYIVKVRDKEFDIGTHDCCTFAGGAVEAITGVDPMPEFRDDYDSWDSAEESLTRIGAGDLFKTLARKFGAALPGSQGHKGDVVWFEGSCGISIGRYGMFIGANGYVLVRITRLERAFRIPY